MNFIKNQKVLYVRAFERLLGDFTLETDAKNAYDRCKVITSRTQALTQDILRANATFRQVVQCYPNYLGDFKKAFSSIERTAGLLKGELDRRSTEALEHRDASEQVALLKSYKTGIGV